MAATTMPIDARMVLIRVFMEFVTGSWDGADYRAVEGKALPPQHPFVADRRYPAFFAASSLGKYTRFRTDSFLATEHVER